MTVYPNRINEIVNSLERSSLFADIGCDHAYVCIQAIREGKAEKAFACDVNKGPLDRAKQNILESGLESKITVCLSNGLSSVSVFPDSCAICGMGGLLIKDILISSAEKLSLVQQMILGPHSEVAELRRYIEEESEFTIRSEKIIEEQKKFYIIMDVRRKTEQEPLNWTEEEYLTGKRELQIYPELFDRYIKHLYEKYRIAYEKISSRGNKAEFRKNELKKILSVFQEKYECL